MTAFDRIHRHQINACWNSLDFELELPAGWLALQPRPVPIDFERDPAAMQSLLRACSPDMAFTLEISARPFDATRSLGAAAADFCSERSLSPLDDGGAGVVGARRAFVGLARHGHGNAAAAVHYAYLVDAERVVEILLHGPQSRAADLQPVWALVTSSFRLTFALDPADAPDPTHPIAARAARQEVRVLQ